MRKIILFMYITLDGFVSGPNGEFDDFEPSIEEHQYSNQLFRSSSGVLFGRITYQGFVEYWDSLDLSNESIPAVEKEFAQIFRSLPRVVFSQTLRTVDDKTMLINANIAEQVHALKAQPGSDLLLVCGPELLADLISNGLVDELMLLVKPKLLGKGKALFGDLEQKLNLSLLSTKIFASGVVLHHYQITT